MAPLVRPDYVLARGLGEHKVRGRRHPYSPPASNMPAHNGGTLPPPAYATPPGLQLIQVAHTAAVSPPQAAGRCAALLHIMRSLVYTMESTSRVGGCIVP